MTAIGSDFGAAIGRAWEAATTGRNQGPQRYSRVNVRVPVRISSIDPEIDPSTGKPFFHTSEEVCLNLSHGGAFVATAEGIAPGRRLLVELDLPDGSSLQSVGQVVWSRVPVPGDDASRETRAGFGIQFMGSRLDHVGELDKFLQRHARPWRGAGDPIPRSHSVL